jgi:hypothetical protein
VSQSLEQREVGYRRDRTTGQDDLEPADAVGQPSEEDEEWRARNVRKRLNRNSRYLELEKRRQELLRRLGTAAPLENDPRPRRTAMTLLNRKFRTARLGQRVSILAAGGMGRQVARGPEFDVLTTIAPRVIHTVQLVRFGSLADIFGSQSRCRPYLQSRHSSLRAVLRANSGQSGKAKRSQSADQDFLMGPTGLTLNGRRYFRGRARRASCPIPNPPRESRVQRTFAAWPCSQPTHRRTRAADLFPWRSR